MIYLDTFLFGDFDFSRPFAASKRHNVASAKSSNPARHSNKSTEHSSKVTKNSNNRFNGSKKSISNVKN